MPKSFVTVCAVGSILFFGASAFSVAVASDGLRLELRAPAVAPYVSDDFSTDILGIHAGSTSKDVARILTGQGFHLVTSATDSISVEMGNPPETYSSEEYLSTEWYEQQRSGIIDRVQVRYSSPVDGSIAYEIEYAQSFEDKHLSTGEEVFAALVEKYGDPNPFREKTVGDSSYWWPALKGKRLRANRNSFLFSPEHLKEDGVDFLIKADIAASGQELFGVTVISYLPGVEGNIIPGYKKYLLETVPGLQGQMPAEQRSKPKF